MGLKCEKLYKDLYVLLLSEVIGRGFKLSNLVWVVCVWMSRKK